MDANPQITLVFVNYQSIWHLSFAVKKLFSFEGRNTSFEVIVVNNDKKERIACEELAKRLPVKVFHSSQNRGFAFGANYGAQKARGHIIGFLNPDTAWQKEQLGEIGALFIDHKVRKIVGLALLDEKGKQERFSYGKAPTLLRLLKNNLLPFFSANHFPPEWVSGGALFILKDTFFDLNGFDERFFLYFEDVDLCIRAKKQGGYLDLYSQGIVSHRGGKSFSSRRAQKDFFYRSQEQYFQKHRPFFEYQFVRSWHRIVRGI